MLPLEEQLSMLVRQKQVASYSPLKLHHFSAVDTMGTLIREPAAILAARAFMTCVHVDVPAHVDCRQRKLLPPIGIKVVGHRFKGGATTCQVWHGFHSAVDDVHRPVDLSSQLDFHLARIQI